jgi:hypothetical protein
MSGGRIGDSLPHALMVGREPSHWCHIRKVTVTKPLQFGKPK